MQKLVIVFLLSIVHTTIPIVNKPIKLEQKFLTHADGTFIKADLIEQMSQLQHSLHIILYGDQKKGLVPVGNYTFKGKLYNLSDLAHIKPQTDRDQKELNHCFMKAKAEFVTAGSTMHKTSQIYKIFMGKLMRESCEKRKRFNSPLLTYAQSNNDQEFLDKITQIYELYIFVFDLYNFVGDVIHNCPNAYRMYKERMGKMEKINELCNSIPVIKDNMPMRIKFLTFIKEKELHKLKDNNITQEHVAALFKKFSRI